MSIYTRKEFKVILAIALIITFVIILAALRSCSRVGSPVSVSAPSAMSKPGSLLPDLQILNHTNPYGVDGLCAQIFYLNDTTIRYRCNFFNSGTAPFIQPRFVLLPNFLEIKMLDLVTGWTWEGYKSEYDFSTDCLDQSKCVGCFPSPDTMCVGIYYYDIYDNDIPKHLGKVAASVTINAANQFPELNTHNNTNYFGFRADSNGITYDSSFVTQKVKNQLDHIGWKHK